MRWGGEGGLIIGCSASKSYMKGIIEKLTPVKAVASCPSGFFAYQLLS